MDLTLVQVGLSRNDWSSVTISCDPDPESPIIRVQKRSCGEPPTQPEVTLMIAGPGRAPHSGVVAAPNILKPPQLNLWYIVKRGYCADGDQRKLGKVIPSTTITAAYNGQSEINN